MTTVSELRTVVNKSLATRDALYKEQTMLLAEHEDIVNAYINTQKAKEVIHQVAQKTLEQLSVNVSSLVTQALKSVFDDPYIFLVEFCTKRNQTECEFYIQRRGCKIDPLDASGGGVADIISFALRAVFLKLSGQRPLLLLDEPFKFLSSDLQQFASQMLKTISTQLGIQVVMVTHLPELIGCVDNVIKVSQNKGVSTITHIQKG